MSKIQYKELLKKFMKLHNQATGRILPLAVADRFEKEHGRTSRPGLLTFGFSLEEENEIEELMQEVKHDQKNEPTT